MDEVPFLSDLDSTGKLVAILRLKKEAAKFESDNRATYEFIHIEHIFTLIQSIESFHGALASAHKMTSSEEKNVDDVLSSLIEPKGIDKIRSKLREEEMVTHDLCQILAIPSPNDFSEPKSRIERLLGPTLKLVETMATYSQKYWDMFKAVRNVFAHNYRFVFLDRLLNFREKDYVESVVGFLHNKTSSFIRSIYVGPQQRLVMIELSMQLAQIEQWVYQNMRDFALNDWNPFPPLGLTYNSEKEKKEYLAIRQRHELYLKRAFTPIKFVLEFKEQLKLHEAFERANYEVTGRRIVKHIEREPSS
jgi:hypothetical protein